jgi:hypothetical protein
MYNLLFWILVQLVLLHCLYWIARGYRHRKLMKAIFLPALVLESFFRMVACFVSGRPVQRLALLEDGAPFLCEGRSQIPHVGELFFLVLWQGSVYLTFHLSAPGIESLDPYAVELPDVEPHRIPAGVVDIDAEPYWAGVADLWHSCDLADWRLWVFVYLMLGVFPYLAINTRDLLRGVLVVAGCALVTFVAQYLGIRPGFLSRGWWLAWWILPDCFRIYSLFFTLLAFTVATHLGALLVYRILSVEPEPAPRKKKQQARRKRRSRQVESTP